jgi:hypothetical protein
MALVGQRFKQFIDKARNLAIFGEMARETDRRMAALGNALPVVDAHGVMRARQRVGNQAVAVSEAVLAPFGNVLQWSRQQYQDYCAGLGHPWLAQAVPQVGGVPQFMSVVPASFFTTPDWAAFANELKGVQEVVRWTMYSYKTYPAAGVTNLLFFDQSEGTAGAAGRLDTNMTNPGSLPGNEMLVVVGTGFDPIPSPTDVFVLNGPSVAGLQWYSVLTQGWLEVKISGKEYLVIAPLTRIPPGHGLGLAVTASAAAATTQNVAQVQSGSPDNRAKYNVDPPFGILPQRPFEARIRYNALQLVTTAGRVGVAFDGWKVRPVL